MTTFNTLNLQASSIWALADEIDTLINNRSEDSLVIVKKTCGSCGTRYEYWDKEDCDGETALGLWYTCKTETSSGDICGSTLLHLSDTQKKKLKDHKKRKQKHA